MVINPAAIFSSHHVTTKFQNNKLKLGLAQRQTVCPLLFTSGNHLGLFTSRDNNVS